MITLIGESLKQWEIGRKVKIKSDKPYNEVHFAQIGDAVALVVEPKDNTAEIPNILLQDARKLIVYLVLHTDESEIAQEMARFEIESRPKPSDYVYTETEAKTYEALEKRLAILEKGGASEEVIAEAVKEYLESHPIQETDPNVAEWAKEPQKPTYTAEEVGAMPKDAKIPTKTSEMTNDSDFVSKKYVDDKFTEYVDEVAELVDENLALLGGVENE